MNHLRRQWKAITAGRQQGVHFVFLPKDATEAHAALLDHHRLTSEAAAVNYPPIDEEAIWTRDVMQALTLRQSQEPGFTLHDHMGDAPTSGFMVSVDPINEEIIPLVDLRHHPEWVGDYFDRHAYLLSDPNNYIGGWVYRGRVFLDVSTHTNDANLVRELCVRYNQKAYYDLASKTSVFIDRPGVLAAFAILGQTPPPVRAFGRNATALADQVGAMAREADLRWTRDSEGYGWHAADRSVFLERGAPMSSGGTNAWLIWVAVPDEEIEASSSDSEYGWSVHHSQETARKGSYISPDCPPNQWYIHVYDAGALAEAKETAEKALAERA